ncbi:hypothetical protein [Streptomyces sp. NPDC101132]|uniref:hypothetical protein n=1 Tax=Streptomyces sp. NPDC101132 TaxID=3366110 RepID=UPI00380659F0
MSGFWELVFLAAVAVCVGTTARLVSARRAERRAGAGDRAAVPCRIAWYRQDRKGLSRYGKVTVTPEGLRFKNPLRGPRTIAPGGAASQRSSMRPGFALLDYRTPQGERMEILVGEGDLALLRRWLRAA